MNNDNTIQQAKDYLHNNWKKGVKCPCCGQFVRLYEQKITSGMAYCLLDLFKKSLESEPVHITNIGNASASGGAFAQLAHWGLIASKKNTDTAKRTSGYWYITEKGKRFVRNEISVPAYMFRFDGRCLGFSERSISIKDALTSKFNYSELMGDLNSIEQNFLPLI